MQILELNALQKGLIIGTMLGDGNFQTNDNGITWRMRVVHKAAHEPYIYYKYKIMKGYCGSPPIYSEVTDQRTNKVYKRYAFNTLAKADFAPYANLFYTPSSEGLYVKHVPQNIGEYLTPLALAFWYMDDGALKWKGRSNAVRLCTDSFSFDEVELLRQTLIDKFGLSVSTQKKDGKDRLCILEKSYPLLKELIVDHLIPSMYYKFPDGNKGVYQGEDLLNDIHNTFRDSDPEDPEL